jgi:hypothetical protein
LVLSRVASANSRRIGARRIISFRSKKDTSSKFALFDDTDFRISISFTRTTQIVELCDFVDPRPQLTAFIHPRHSRITCIVPKTFQDGNIF